MNEANRTRESQPLRSEARADASSAMAGEPHRVISTWCRDDATRLRALGCRLGHPRPADRLRAACAPPSAVRHRGDGRLPRRADLHRRLRPAVVEVNILATTGTRLQIGSTALP